MYLHGMLGTCGFTAMKIEHWQRVHRKPALAACSMTRMQARLDWLTLEDQQRHKTLSFESKVNNCKS
jgi:hypothetical protein